MARTRCEVILLQRIPHAAHAGLPSSMVRTIKKWDVAN